MSHDICQLLSLRRHKIVKIVAGGSVINRVISPFFLETLLFALDVLTDLANGSKLINNEHPVLGYLMLILVCLPVALVCFVGIVGVAYLSYDWFDHARVYVKGLENPTKKERKQLKRNWGTGGTCKAQDEQSEELKEVHTAAQEEKGIISLGQKMTKAVEKTKADLKKKTELKRIGNKMVESAVKTGEELLESTEAALVKEKERIDNEELLRERDMEEKNTMEEIKEIITKLKVYAQTAITAINSFKKLGARARIIISVVALSLLVALYIPVVVLLTIFYIVYVIACGIRRMIYPNPEWVLDDLVKEEAVGVFFSPDVAAALLAVEICLESGPQAGVGKSFKRKTECTFFPGQYTIVTLEPSPDHSRIMQYLGMAVSLISLTKGCATWMLFTGFNVFKHFGNTKKQIPVSLSSVVKSLAFFLPHVVFRITAMSVSLAFLRKWGLIPCIVDVVTHVILIRIVDVRDKSLFISFPMTLLSPTVAVPTAKNHQHFLKLSILASSIIQLLTLICVLLLPSMAFFTYLPSLPFTPLMLDFLPLMNTTDTLLCTKGLHHLNFNTSTMNHTLPFCYPSSFSVDKTFSQGKFSQSVLFDICII